MPLDDVLVKYLDSKFDDVSNQITNIGRDQRDLEERVDDHEKRITNFEMKNARKAGAAAVKAGIGATLLALFSGAMGFLGAIFGVMPHGGPHH